MSRSSQVAIISSCWPWLNVDETEICTNLDYEAPFILITLVGAKRPLRSIKQEISRVVGIRWTKTYANVVNVKQS